MRTQWKYVLAAVDPACALPGEPSSASGGKAPLWEGRKH